jgi:SAM-dependent MidA family methyltransferase
VAVVDGRLADVAGPPSTPALEARLAAEGITLAEGQLAEICLAADAWVAAAAGGLAKGLLLLIDYGHPAAALYDNRRRPAEPSPRTSATGSTTTRTGDRAAGPDRPRRRHRGRGAAAAAGVEPVATTTQGRFLAGLGLATCSSPCSPARTRTSPPTSTRRRRWCG